MPLTPARSNLALQPTQYALELDGQFAGFLKGFEGGDAVGEVVPEQLGADGVRHKHIGNVKYEDIVLAFGADMPASIYDWIAGTLARNYARRDGAIVGSDVSGQTYSRMEFSRAMIREITFPALDASSKNAALIRATLAPEFTRPQPVGGVIPSTASKAKPWLVQNYRLQIDGLDCTKVNSIDALTIDYDLESGAVGEFRDYVKTPNVPNIPNLAFTIAQSGADSLVAWHEDFVIKRNNSAQNEKNGTLQFLAANVRDVLFTLTFQNLGIFKLKRVKDSGSISRLRAEMYCEAIGFDSAANTSQQTPQFDIKQNDQSNSGKTARPLLRGAYALSPAAMAGSNLAIAPLSPPRSPEPVTNTLNLGTTLKFRT